MRIESRARFSLAQLPTPIEKLKSLSRELGGPELLIKRDDQIGLALGGNKTRKLEFLVGQALEAAERHLFSSGCVSCRERLTQDPPQDSPRGIEIAASKTGSARDHAPK